MHYVTLHTGKHRAYGGGGERATVALGTVPGTTFLEPYYSYPCLLVAGTSSLVR